MNGLQNGARAGNALNALNFSIARFGYSFINIAKKQKTKNTMNNNRANEISPSPKLALILTLLLAAFTLAICAQFVDWGEIFVSGMSQTLNDQVAYISAGKTWNETGTLATKLIYPSTLLQDTKTNAMYMPGHYWLLAMAYKYLGYSVPISFLPSLIAFFISTISLFVIANKLYGQTIAFYSCTLFILFPLNLVYSFTAMAEMAVVAATLMAFTVYILLPLRLRIWVGPLLVALPVLFRETGAAVAILMVIVMLGGKEKKWKATFCLCGLSGLMLIAVLSSPIATGRPSLFAPNVLFGGAFDPVYSNAYSVQRLHAESMDWVHALFRKLTINVKTLISTRNIWSSLPFLESASMLFILSGIPIGLLMWFRRRDMFALAVAAMVTVVLLAILCFYTVWNFRGVRVLLLCQPFVALVWASIVTISPRYQKIGKRIVAVLLLLIAVGVGGMYSVFVNEDELNAFAKADTAFLESIGHDDQGLLVSSYTYSFGYVLKHHPVQWSFIPANGDTLRLLDKRYPVGTLIVPNSGSSRTYLSDEDIVGIGLVLVDSRDYKGSKLDVYKRPPGQKKP
jgi:hypothetical protein